MKMMGEIENLLLVKAPHSTILNILIEQKRDNDLCPTNIADILALSCIRNDSLFKLNLLVMLLRNGCIHNFIIEELFTLLTEYPGLLAHEENISTLQQVTKQLPYHSFTKKQLQMLADLFEAMYAHKIFDLKSDIITIYTMMDSNIPSDRLKSRIIRAKFALAAYSANNCNRYENMHELDRLYEMIHDAKLKQYRGIAHYYYGIFKQHNPNMSSRHFSYYDDSYMHFERSQKYSYWLSEIMIKYL